MLQIQNREQEMRDLSGEIGVHVIYLAGRARFSQRLSLVDFFSLCAVVDCITHLAGAIVDWSGCHEGIALLATLASAEKTNTRVAVFSILSLLVCIASGGLQLFFLRRFFQRKKLL
jgi:hypothetical protein